MCVIEHGGRVDHAAWIADAHGQPASLSSSVVGCQIRLTRLPTCDEIILATPGSTSSHMQAQWVPEVFGRACILGWQYRHGLTVWDAATGEELKFRPAMVWGAVWSAELRSVLYWSNRVERDTAWPERNITLWTPETDQCHVYQFPKLIDTPVFEEDGRFIRHRGDGATLVSAGLQAPAVLGWSSMGWVALWDALTSQVIAPPLQHHAPVLGAAWIPDTRHGPAILSWSLDGTVMLNPISAGAPLLSAKLEGRAEGAAFIRASHPRFLAWSDNGDLLLCEHYENGGVALVGFRHAGPVRGATWLPDLSDGPAVLSWADDSNVRLASALTGKVICRFNLDARPTAFTLLPSQQPHAVSFAVGCRSGSIGVFDFVDR
jgi:hypothetical protein